jgi:hypothetical protein
MAENNNRMVVYLSIAVVLLLVAFVVVVVVVTGLKTAPPTTTAGNTPSNPKKFVTSYYQAILDKKWDVAFKMQPAKSQVGQSVEAFQQTQEQMYGMTSFEIASSQIGSTEATVVVAQTLREPNGVWTAVWTFVNDKGTWLVQARKVNMGAPTATP